MAERFAYFAYGSNMLTQRLTRRCPSAVAVGPAVLDGHRLAFSKVGRDGSGKATILSAPDARVFGVVFMLDIRDLDLLDAFEGRGTDYDRIDHCEVRLLADNAVRSAVTYKAPEVLCDPALVPFDWYHALVVAGARQHGLPADYIAMLAACASRSDPDNLRPTALEARDVLTCAGLETGGRNGAFTGHRP